MGRKSKKQLDEALLSDRRRRVAEYWFEGVTVKQMATIFKVDERTIYRDQEYIEEHAEDMMKNYLVKTLPLILSRSLHQIERANNEAMRILKSDESSNKEKLTAALAISRTARDSIEIVAGNKSIVDKALDLDESLKQREEEEVNEFLRRNSAREEEERPRPEPPSTP